MISISTADTKQELLAYPSGEKILVNNLHQEIGGGGTNTAVGFSRMGFKTGFFGALARDRNSEIILENLSAEKVDFLGVRKSGGTNVSVVLDSQYDDRTILVFKDVSEKLEKKDIKKLDARWLYCTTMQGKSFSVLEKIVSVAKKQGVKVVFNSSSYLTKQGLKTCLPIFKHTDILILNRDEAKALFEGKNDIDELLKKLRKHVKMPIITDGKNGAYVLVDKTIISAKPKKNLKIKETTGAGDAFSTGFISGMMMQLKIDDCLKLGMLNSESVIQKLGAKNDLLTKNRAFELLKKDKRTITKLKFN